MYRQTITSKISAAISKGSKLRLEDLIEDNSIKVDNEDVEDSLRIICNNTGKTNFKQKVEDLKKYVIPKPPTVGIDGTEIIDEKSFKAEDNLRWFIQYILAKRLGA